MMGEKTKYALSRTISYVMHPLIVPTIAVLLIMFGNTVMEGMGIRAKWFVTGLVALDTLVIPLILLGMMRSLKIIPDMVISGRAERMMPLMMALVCFGLCAYMLAEVKAAFMVSKFLYASIVGVAAAFAINFFWKISLHMIAAGGLVAMMIMVDIYGLGYFGWPLAVAVLAAGALGSARLYLGSHNPAQVAAGFGLGFVTMAAGMVVF